MTCYGCAYFGHRHTHDVLFTDSRTNRSFCHHCIEALVSWEQANNSKRHSDDCFWDWIGVDVPQTLGLAVALGGSK